MDERAVRLVKMGDALFVISFVLMDSKTSTTGSISGCRGTNLTACLFHRCCFCSFIPRQLPEALLFTHFCSGRMNNRFFTRSDGFTVVLKRASKPPLLVMVQTLSKFDQLVLSRHVVALSLKAGLLEAGIAQQMAFPGEHLEKCFTGGTVGMHCASAQHQVGLLL